MVIPDSPLTTHHSRPILLLPQSVSCRMAMLADSTDRPSASSVMGSPFPGMDPYIEARHLFEDLHNCLIADLQRAISDVLPDNYTVRSGERSYVALAQVDDGPDHRHFVPDISVASTRSSMRKPRKAKGSSDSPALQAPPGAVLMRPPKVMAEYREAFVEIRQMDPDHKLVTGIEVLSPSNKDYGSKGWWLYYRKRRAFLNGYA